ncbi:1338_t:CDS:2 [Cetraspora pellucida]|uniref:1338_t:CDS:1 n=1 Tax=Cetraspora pellucida TaxID=1433469 RepID=A0A9N9E7P0_9GLOM|nr:1338_t:CDS:2 [Cetraspora pellucida]
MSESEFTCQDFEKCINSKKNNKNSFTVASKENSQDDFTITSEENSQNGFIVTSEENSQDGFTVDNVALVEAFANAQQAFIERPHRGNPIMLCTELEKHENDTSDTLIDIRR